MGRWATRALSLSERGDDDASVVGGAGDLLSAQNLSPRIEDAEAAAAKPRVGCQNSVPPANRHVAREDTGFGTPHALAMEVAGSGVDVHEIERLITMGCEFELAYEILR